jgi:hypothetical protein
MSTYAPQPLDTSKVRLSETQRALVEALAANVHDVWARKRVDDGWRFGANRNDEAKTHPCLVPYDELPESEKSYDREMVEQVVKAAVLLGYHIDKGGA